MAPYALVRVPLRRLIKSRHHLEGCQFGLRLLTSPELQGDSLFCGLKILRCQGWRSWARFRGQRPRTASGRKTEKGLLGFEGLVSLAFEGFALRWWQAVAGSKELPAIKWNHVSPCLNS